MRRIGERGNRRTGEERGRGGKGRGRRDGGRGRGKGFGAGAEVGQGGFDAPFVGEHFADFEDGDAAREEIEGFSAGRVGEMG